MIRVLQVINWFRRGGVETQLLQILRNYDRSRFHMDVCCYGDEIGYLAPEAKKCGAAIFHCPKSANLYSLSRRFARFLAERRYHIVHCNSEAWSGPILRGARYAGVPVRIGHIRINLPQGFMIQRPLPKLARNVVMAWGRFWLLKYATHIMGVSAAALDARFPSWREKHNFSLWTLGVDVNRFVNSRHIGGKKVENPIIINVASFSPQKRQDLVLHILNLVLARRPDAKMRFVGEGGKLESCRVLAESLRISDRVDFLGLRDDIPELLNKAHLFLSCSEAEGLPNVVLEAQASGLPVVVSDIAPHREALPEISRDFLFRHDNLDVAADNIIRILDEPVLYGKLCERGRAYACEYYDAATNLKRLERMYMKWLETV